MENKKLKQEELTKLQELVGNYNQHQSKVGELEVQKHQIMHAISDIQNSLQGFQNELRDAYGDVTIDINTGEIKENEPSKED